MLDNRKIKAVVFDIFGTTVDYHTSVNADVALLSGAKGLSIDSDEFTTAWRCKYGPFMEQVRTKTLPWVKLDDLHRMMLDQTLDEFDSTVLSAAERAWLNKTWHRLKAWPDVAQGLQVMKECELILAPLSNGNISMMVDLAQYNHFPWDCILGAELVRHYKPDPEVYISAYQFLDLMPDNILMVAAHLGDLRAAKAVGLQTALVNRPLALGPKHDYKVTPDETVDITVNDFKELATALTVVV